jgi:hypothetical protein
MMAIRPEEIKSVKEVLSAFVNTANNYYFYPSDHIIRKESLNKLISSLNAFFNLMIEFKIEIKRDGLFFKGEKVNSISNANDPLCVPLFRDGVWWFEILPGINSIEIDNILKILCKHRVLNEEPEDDIVTSLWNANLSNFRYKAVDSYFENKPIFNYNDFKINKNAQSEEKIYKNNYDTHLKKPNISISVANFFELTAIDKELLQNLIDQDKRRKKDEDLVDILIITLKDSVLDNEVSAILDLLKEEFKEAISSANFQLAFKIILKIKNVYSQNKDRSNNFKKLIYDFWFKISGNEVSKPLEYGLTKLDPHNVVFFKRTILMLNHNIIYVLVNFLSNAKLKNLHRLFMETVGILATKNIAPIERLFNSKDEELLKKLVRVVSTIKTPQAICLLTKITGHESEIIRLQALIELIRVDKLSRERIFAMINDTSLKIRLKILKYLANEKNIFNERMMRNYVERIDSTHSDSEHILMCYRTLGRCGSNSSIDFLKYHLFKWPIFGFLNRKQTVHRKGAAIALFEIGTKEAKVVLESASRSLFPGLRKAHRKAFEMK